MTKEVKALVHDKAIASVLGLLLAGNIYFIKRLVDRIDVSYDMARDVRQGLIVLEMRVDRISSYVREVTRSDQFLHKGK